MVLTQKYINDVSYKIVGCAIEVHKNLGPGLLESVYETCLKEELKQNNLFFESQVIIPVLYEGKNLNATLKIDLLVNEVIIVELKAVELILPLHKAQLLSYLKLMDKPKGLLINFNCENITTSLIPLVTKRFSELEP